MAERPKNIMPNDEEDQKVTVEEVVQEQKERRKLTQRGGKAGRASIPLIITGVLASCLGLSTAVGSAVVYRPARVTESSSVGQSYRYAMLQVLLDPKANSHLINEPVLFGFKSNEQPTQSSLVAYGHLHEDYERLARGEVGEIEQWIRDYTEREVQRSISDGQNYDKLLDTSTYMIRKLDEYKDECENRERICDNFAGFIDQLSEYGVYPYIEQNLRRINKQQP